MTIKTTQPADARYAELAVDFYEGHIQVNLDYYDKTETELIADHQLDIKLSRLDDARTKCLQLQDQHLDNQASIFTDADAVTEIWHDCLSDLAGIIASHHSKERV